MWRKRWAGECEKRPRGFEKTAVILMEIIYKKYYGEWYYNGEQTDNKR